LPHLIKECNRSAEVVFALERLGGLVRGVWLSLREFGII